jgi:hypothetical protein
MLSDLELKSAGSAAARARKSAILGVPESDDEREKPLCAKAKPFFPYGFAPILPTQPVAIPHRPWRKACFA